VRVELSRQPTARGRATALAAREPQASAVGFIGRHRDETLNRTLSVVSDL